MSRRPHLLRSRRALLWTFAVYCALQVSALELIVSIPSLREPFYGRKLMRLRSLLAKESAPPFTVVAIGSSRTLDGLRGNLIGPAIAERVGQPAVIFNMGVPAVGPVGNLMNLRRLLDDGIKPDVAILEVMPVFLIEEGPKREVRDDALPISSLRLAEVGLVRRYAAGSRSLSHGEWWLAHCNPIHTERFSILSRFLPMILARSSVQCNFDNMDGFGWYPFPNLGSDKETHRRAIRKMRSDYEPWLKNQRMSSDALRPIQEALQLCRERHITAVLILMPEGPVFRSLYAPGAREQVLSLLEAVSRAWTVPVIDARDWFPDEAAFFDSHHPHDETATIFTHRLAKELLALPAFRRDKDSDAMGLFRSCQEGKR